MNAVITGPYIQGIIMNSNYCTEVVMPTEMLNIEDFTYTWRDAGSLKKITLPSSVELSETGQIGFWFKALSNSVKSDNVEEITTAAWTVPSSCNLSLDVPRKLLQFNQPTLKPARLSIIGSSYYGNTSLNRLDIDFSGLDPAYDVLLSYNQFDAAELERISGLLPIVSSGNVKFLGNPGYSTFDRTIAESRGWTII